MSVRRRVTHSIRTLLVAAVLVTSCAAPGAPAPSASCTEAFATAVGTRTGDEGVPFHALRPVFTACATVAEWSTEWTRHHGLGYLGTPTEILGRMCEEPLVKDERLCVAARSTP